MRYYDTQYNSRFGTFMDPFLFSSFSTPPCLSLPLLPPFILSGRIKTITTGHFLKRGRESRGKLLSRAIVTLIASGRSTRG